MARIKHPNPKPGTFTDRLGGVVFHDGFAEVDLVGDDNLRDAYLMHGYEVEETPTADGDLAGLMEASDAAGDILDLETLSVPQLRTLARIRSVEVPKRATKAELVDLISRAPAAPAIGFAVVELPDGTVIGDGKSLATLPVYPDGIVSAVLRAPIED